MTRQALVAYSIGLIGMILVKVLAPGFYARQDIKTPVKIGILTLVMTQVMNLAFIFPLRHAGLALSIGLAACLNAALLFHTLRKRKLLPAAARLAAIRPAAWRRAAPARRYAVGGCGRRGLVACGVGQWSAV